MTNLNEEIASMLSGSVEGQIKFEGGGGTSNYNELLNKPKINNVELTGDKTTDDLGLFDGDYNNLVNKPTIPPAPVIMVGATSETDGSSGYVPQPLTSDVDKFLNGAGEWVSAPTGEIHYSTTEQVIGTWIDGKPLYQKTIITNNSSVNVDVAISLIDLNIDTLVAMVGRYTRIATWASLEFIYDFNCYETSDYYSYSRYSITNKEIQYSIHLGPNETTNYQMFTLQYTKTTD